VWDIRKFSQPIGTVTGLQNDEDHMDAVFSPDERYLVTGRQRPCATTRVATAQSHAGFGMRSTSLRAGTSVKRNEGYGHLLVIDRNTFELVKQTGSWTALTERRHP